MKDANTTLIVGLLAVIVVALGTMLAITYSRTDPVVLIGFAGTIITGLLAFLRAGQAADEAARAKKEAALSTQITAQAAATVQEIKVSVDGKMGDLLEQTKLAASSYATLIERSRGEEIAASLAAVTDAALIVAQAAPAVGSPQEVTIVQAADSPVPVALATPVPVEVMEVKDEEQDGK